MTARNPGRHRASRRPITPLTPIARAAQEATASAARRGALLAAGSGLLVSAFADTGKQPVWAAVIGWIAGRLEVPIGSTFRGFDVSVSLSGSNALAFALVLFVLARVFRHGNRLAQDLEGTV